MATAKAVGKVEAVVTFGGCIGARPPEYEKRIVRNRHTGLLEEVEMNPELPPIDEGDAGTFYVFKEGQQVRADHPAVVEWPHHFAPVEG